MVRVAEALSTLLLLLPISAEVPCQDGECAADNILLSVKGRVAKYARLTDHEALLEVEDKDKPDGKKTKSAIVKTNEQMELAAAKKGSKLLEEEEENEEEEVLVQYTPDQADWSGFQWKPMAVRSITAHDPDSIGWISKSKWDAAKWDGVPIDPCVLTKKQLGAKICPSGDTLLGLREVFYEHKPFKDNANPTKAEVDEWHRIAINHFRALVNYTEPERQIKPDHCLFARALWGDERKSTTVWDTKYPLDPSATSGCGKLDSACGPCKHPDSDNGHCGASFLPSKEEQAPYLPDGYNTCSAGAGAEGCFSAPKSNIPWSIKFTRALCHTLATEGMSGHSGPWFHREKFGFSFWDANPTDKGCNAGLRAKWGGRLMERKCGTITGN